MKTWILPSLMMAVAATLVVAIFSPDAMRDLLSVPKGWIEANRTEALQVRTTDKWARVRQQAAGGDTDAMFHLGMKMRFPTDQQMSGVPVDPAGGLELIRSAADAGHVDAAIELWKSEDRSAGGLIHVAERALERQEKPENLMGLAEWLQWTTVQSCSDVVLETAVRVTGIVSDAGHLNKPDSRRYRAFPQAYALRCKGAQSPLTRTSTAARA